MLLFISVCELSQLNLHVAASSNRLYLINLKKRWILYEILLKNLFLLMAAFSNVGRNDVLIMTSRFNTPLIISMDSEMLVCY